MSIFDSRKSKERKSAIADLYHVMIAEGEIDKIEMAWFVSVFVRLGASQQEVQEIVANPDKIPFVAPQDPVERLSRLEDMVIMMIANGEIEERERNLCMKLAIKLGFEPSLVDRMVVEKIAKLKMRQQS